MDSGNLGAYCTLRSEDKKKKSNNVHFGSLRNRRNDAGHNSSNNLVTNDKFTVPYNQLEESISSENFSFYNDETPPPLPSAPSITEINEAKTNAVIPDLITLEEESPTEAINISLLEKIENDLLQTRSAASSAAAAANHRKTNSQNNTLIKDEDQHHHQSLSEFKRLSSYCTLRPDQKRKYLLRTISHLRSSKNASLEANRALQAFQYLDSIESLTLPAAAAVACSDELTICSDPEKVEDCLMELDAYLEEIERNCVYHNDNTNTIKENEYDLKHDRASSDTLDIIPLVNVSGANGIEFCVQPVDEEYTETFEINENNCSDLDRLSDCGKNNDSDEDDDDDNYGAIGLDHHNIHQKNVFCSRTQSVRDNSKNVRNIYYENSDVNKVNQFGRPRGHPYRNTISSVGGSSSALVTTFSRHQRGRNKL